VESAELVVALDPAESRELLVMLRSGWGRGKSYRVSLTSPLRDNTGRRFEGTESLEWKVPGGGDGNNTPPIIFEKKAKVQFETFQAAGNTVGLRIPGGQNRLFHGLWMDPTTGMAYARARWYDSRNEAWLREDPHRDIDSPNLYSFTAWRPNSLTDPYGTETGSQVADAIEASIDAHFGSEIPQIDRINRLGWKIMMSPMTAFLRTGNSSGEFIAEFQMPRRFFANYQELKAYGNRMSTLAAGTLLDAAVVYGSVRSSTAFARTIGQALEGSGERLAASAADDVVWLYHGTNEEGALGLSRGASVDATMTRGLGDDFGQALYFSEEPGVAINATERKAGDSHLWIIKAKRSDLGKVVDILPGGEHNSLWENFLKSASRPGSSQTWGDLYNKVSFEARGEIFEYFLRSYGLEADVVFGPLAEGAVQGGTSQVAIRSQDILKRITSAASKQ